MGVPRLFIWIKNTFGNSVKSFKLDWLLKTQIKTDYLLLDANGLLHRAAQIVFKYGEYENKDNKSYDPYFYMTYDEKVMSIYYLFFEMIIKLTCVIFPMKVLYIALDGPAPLAKQIQQRQRRFLAKIGHVDNEDTKDKFDSNCITRSE